MEVHKPWEALNRLYLANSSTVTEIGLSSEDVANTLCWFSSALQLLVKWNKLIHNDSHSHSTVIYFAALQNMRIDYLVLKVTQPSLLKENENTTATDFKHHKWISISNTILWPSFKNLGQFTTKTALSWLNNRFDQKNKSCIEVIKMRNLPFSPFLSQFA